jgi:hypothetical protein
LTKQSLPPVAASGLTLFPRRLDAARRFERAPDETEMRAQEQRLGVAPLVVRGYAASV